MSRLEERKGLPPLIEGVMFDSIEIDETTSKIRVPLDLLISTVALKTGFSHGEILEVIRDMGAVKGHHIKLVDDERNNGRPSVDLTVR